MENRLPHVQQLMSWLMGLFIISLAINKTLNDAIFLLMFFVSCGVIFYRVVFHIGGFQKIRIFWIVSLTLPLLLVVLQHFALPIPLPVRDFENLARFALCIPVYICLSIVRPDIKPFLWGCAFFAIYSPLLMFWKIRVLDLNRAILPNGFLGVIPFTSLTIILGLLALRLCVSNTGSISKNRFSAILALSVTAAPIASQTRSGFLLLVALGFLVWYLYPHRKLRTLLSVASIFIVILAIVFSSSLLWNRPDKTITEVEGYISDEQISLTSATIRIELWQAAWHMFSVHPLLGVGNHRFSEALKEYRDNGQAPQQLEIFTHAHDDFLNYGAEGGVLGVLSLALLYFVPLIPAIKNYRHHRSFIESAWMVIVFSVGIFAAGLVDVMLAWPSTNLFYGVVSSLLISQMDNEKKNAS